MLPEDVPQALTFDDVLLVPGPSDVLPHEVDLSVQLAPGLNLTVPLISAAMDSVTEARMAAAMARLGGLGVIHRNLSVEGQAAQVASVTAEGLLCGAAVGAGHATDERAAALVQAGASALFVDTAHGHSSRVIQTVARLSKAYPGTPIFAGNVASPDAALALADAGASGVKVGVGPGSICTTRIVAGVGVPQLTAISSVARALSSYATVVVGDGGIKQSGDIVKALAGGAHVVMAGSLFAGTDATPGERFESGGALYKQYRGMGSLGAMSRGSKERYAQDDVKDAKLVPEGVEARVPYRGPLEDVVHQLLGGLRAGMGYVGAGNLAALRAYDRFVRITSAGLGESHVHDVHMTADAPNYRSA
jgi:IMP dehydrogenase